MEFVVIAVGVALTTLALLVLSVHRRRVGDGRRNNAQRRVDLEPHRVRSAAEAEMEEHDIDDMLDAINRRRRQLGRREIGEELADELTRGTWDD